MKKEQWEIIKRCARMERMEQLPIGLIIDSPWIPGYVGISTMDYLSIPEIWLEANLKVKADFPEIIFLPDFWVEYGMATEPSGFGCKVNFYENSTPTINHILESADDLEDIGRIKQPNPLTDGLMPFALNIYKRIEPILKEKGESIKMVAARGPMTIATHIMGLTEFLVGLKTDPDNTHRLLKMTTQMTKDWLEAQADVLSEVEGIMVLDDVVGFLSREDYLEFAHPYMKDIFNSFSHSVKFYHNDTDNVVCYEFLEDLGVNIFNFTHKQDIGKVKDLVGDKVCLFGNVPPLQALYQGSPELVREETLSCITKYGDRPGLILSAGGGASPGTPGANLRAMIEASRT